MASLQGSLLDFLRGRWRLTRVVTLFAPGGVRSEVRVEGSATWAAAAARDGVPADVSTLTYDEEGDLIIHSAAVPSRVSARYLWHCVARGAHARVCFADGRPFHDVDLSAGSCDVHHNCPPDAYDGRFVVTPAGALRVTWRVRGAHKDYESVTLLERAERIE
jgi:hypothetical protein